MGSIKGLLWACLLLSGSALAARSDWREMTVGELHLYSTLRDTKTRDVARQLRAFEKTVGEFLRSEDRLPDVPTIIYILDSNDFQRYGAGRPGLAGVFYERPYANIITINGDLPFETVKVTVFHEYTHFVQRNSSSKKLPPWFVEGYAELFSGFTLDKNQITLGELPKGVAFDMRHWIPVKRLLAVTQRDPEYLGERLAVQFYAESWALVHLLLLDDTSLGRPTANFIDNLDLGLLEPDAFARSFPFDEDGLDHMLHEYLERRAIHIRRITYEESLALDDTVASSPLTAAKADAALARMALMIGWAKQTVAPLAAAALKDSSTDPAVRALSARIAARDGDHQDIDDLISSLEKGGTDRAQLRIDVAATLLSLSQSRFGGDRAMAILDDLAHTDAAPLEAVALWITAAKQSNVGPAKLLGVLEKGSARAPHNTHMLADLAGVQDWLGHPERAREYYERIILVSADPNERLWAQKQSDSVRLQKN